MPDAQAHPVLQSELAWQDVRHAAVVGLRVRVARGIACNGAAARCSGCQQVAPGYDQLAERRFAFIPVWGFLVVLLYRMRRVQCKTCGIVVEAVPWASGKHHLTNAYMQFLAHWARRLSWQETADAFRTSWAQVCHAVEYVVTWGLAHRTLGPMTAIGV